MTSRDPGAGFSELGYGQSHQLEWGGCDPPVLLLHPNGMNARVWELVVRRLTLPNRIVVPDRRGHGLSAAPPAGYGLDDHLGDTLELIGQLGGGPVHVVGAMTGANLGILLASRQPRLVRSLVVIDPAPALDPDVLRFVEESLAEGNLRFPSLEAALAKAADPKWDAETRAHYGRHFFRPAPVGGAGAVEWNFHAPGVLETERALVRPLWDEIHVTCPTLVVRGAQSWVFSPEQQARLVALIPGATVAEVASRLHPPLDDSAGIAAAVDRHVLAVAP